MVPQNRPMCPTATYPAVTCTTMIGAAAIYWLTRLSGLSASGCACPWAEDGRIIPARSSSSTRGCLCGGLLNVKGSRTRRSSSEPSVPVYVYVDDFYGHFERAEARRVPDILRAGYSSPFGGPPLTGRGNPKKTKAMSVVSAALEGTSSPDAASANALLLLLCRSKSVATNQRVP